ncbi:ZIP family metal transporter [Fulvivirga lutea]|uniref:ZIP family metal transporter n=1 Tax=Fulvivirga lutea TaxID=2810512 RepID=A0A974WN18_9BACT|nr:ZIP family metal transporter [Fulvivirga lutea]QSE98478.1 ZIP family metal transporter [Fulvivirga lutea]
MLISLAILFFSALLSGLLVFAIPNLDQKNYKLALVFAGSYLFSITIIHIMPELFSQAENPTSIGIYVLLGFFLQQILEYFTAGAEHGHIHKHEHDHQRGVASSIMVLGAMIVHGLLEGSLLAHPSVIHAHHDANSILFGIVLHKAPASFALMSIIVCQLKRNKLAIIFLVLFALASPIGMVVGDYYVENNALADETFTILFAIVSGNFLHISTTIVFETSSDHHFNARKLAVAVIGALIAVGAEYWF